MDSTKKLKWINKAQIFLTVIASIAFIFGCVFSRQAGGGCLVAVLGLLIAVVSLVAEHEFQGWWASGVVARGL